MDAAEGGRPASRSRSVSVKRPDERRSLSRSATRALDLLELFGQVRHPLRAIEIARALQLQPSTANQLLKTMVGSSHLTFDAAAKSYLPSPRLAHFAGWMVESYGADERLRRLVRDVQTAVGDTVTLTTPNDLYMQVVELAGPSHAGEGAERGLRVSIFGSATGSAFLSTLPDTEIVRLATRARIDPSEHVDLLLHAASVRRAGAADLSSPNGANWSVAAPLPATASPAPLILGLAGPSEQVRPRIAAMRAFLLDAIAKAGPFPLAER